MTGWNAVTVVLSAVLTVLPQVVVGLPKPYADVATAILTVVSSVWHLYTPPPTQSSSPPLTVVKS